MKISAFLRVGKETQEQNEEKGMMWDSSALTAHFLCIKDHVDALNIVMFNCPNHQEL